MNFFKPEDFARSFGGVMPLEKDFCVKLAEIANAKLEREGKRVYGSPDISEGIYAEQYWGTAKDKQGSDTHQALLICIEPIEKKCEHKDPSLIAYDVDAYGSLKLKASEIKIWICECGVKLKPTGWEPVE